MGAGTSQPCWSLLLQQGKPYRVATILSLLRGNISPLSNRFHSHWTTELTEAHSIWVSSGFGWIEMEWFYRLFWNKGSICTKIVHWYRTPGDLMQWIGPVRLISWSSCFGVSTPKSVGWVTPGFDGVKSRHYTFESRLCSSVCRPADWQYSIIRRSVLATDEAYGWHEINYASYLWTYKNAFHAYITCIMTKTMELLQVSAGMLIVATC